MAYQTPEERDRARLREQLAGAARHSPVAGYHPGDWRLHQIMLPESRPGDFTPIRPEHYAEDEATPHGDLLRYLAGMFGIDYGGLIAEHGHQLKAGAEAGQ
jgi:hypothetical protein